MKKSEENKKLDTKGKRIRYIRKKHNLNQTEFGRIIRKSQSMVGEYENDQIDLPDSISLIICDKFNVNESWLMYGAGKMDRDIDMTLAAFAGQAMSGKDDFKKAFFTWGAQISEEEWKVIKDVMFRLFDTMDEMKSKEKMDEKNNK